MNCPKNPQEESSCCFYNCQNKVSKLFKNNPVAAKIKSKSQSQWAQAYKECWESFYNLVTDDGEKALLAGLLAGIIFVLLFKFVLVIAVLIVLVALIIWILADEKATSSTEANVTSKSTEEE